MALTVDNPIELPIPYAQAGYSILTGTTARGWQRCAQAQNSLYEQCKSNLVLDVGGTILDSSLTSETARYRQRNLGRIGSGYTNEVRVYYWLEITGYTGSLALRTTETSSGDTVTYNYPGGNVSGWVNVGLIDADAEPAKLDFEVDVTSFSGVSRNFDLKGVAIGYERGRSALDAVASGSWAYDDGFIPNNASIYADNYPASASKLAALHGNAAVLYNDRVGQVMSSARPGNPLSGDSGFYVLTPAGVTQLDIDLYIANATGTTTVSTWDDSVTENTWSAGADWYTFTLDVQPGRVERIGIEFESTEIESICGSWQDAALPNT